MLHGSHSSHSGPLFSAGWSVFLPMTLHALPESSDSPSELRRNRTTAFLKDQSRLRLGAEVKAVEHVRGLGIPVIKRRQVEPNLCKFEERRKLILGVAHKVLSCIGRNDEERHTRSE